MKAGSRNGSPALINNHNVPRTNYICSLTTSVSQSSVCAPWSDASQRSDDTLITAPSDSDSRDAGLGYSRPSFRSSSRQSQDQCPEVPAEQRRNPRRTSHTATSRKACPPSLVRQEQRKGCFVDSLVDCATNIVEAVWPTSSPCGAGSTHSSAVLSLRMFIKETLRRSRTSYSTLQVALYYLILIKPCLAQPDLRLGQHADCYVSGALQCGRRMFLAALILASKYLQDRNFSARAWSKISGLDTHEINQNEIAFLFAVKWNLHISAEVYNRWTEGVMKMAPNPPTPPSSACALRLFEQRCEVFGELVLKLTPELDNIEILSGCSPECAPFFDRPAVTPRSPVVPLWERPLSPTEERSPSPLSQCADPPYLEPKPDPEPTPGHLAPALGLLPTPRLTPQLPSFSTPAVCAASKLLVKGSAMSFAVSQASALHASVTVDRWPVPPTSSPQSYCTRCSSLANSASTASSPDSMVSDSSLTSRSSSISSALSLASASSSKLDVQSRCRYSWQCSDRIGLRPTIAPSLPLVHEENCLLSSPASYEGSAAKGSFYELPRDMLHVRKRSVVPRSVHEMRGLDPTQGVESGERMGCRDSARPKRSRPQSLDVEEALQNQVRGILQGHGHDEAWSEDTARPRGSNLTDRDKCKRARYVEEVPSLPRISMLHPAAGGVGGPGMWIGLS